MLSGLHSRTGSLLVSSCMFLFCKNESVEDLQSSVGRASLLNRFFFFFPVQNAKASPSFYLQLQQQPYYDSSSHSNEDPSPYFEPFKNPGFIRPSVKHAHNQEYISRSSPQRSPVSTRAYNRKDYDYISSFPWSPVRFNSSHSDERLLQNKGYKNGAISESSISFSTQSHDDDSSQNLHNIEGDSYSSSSISINYRNSDHKLHNTEVEFGTENLSQMQKRLHNSKVEEEEWDTNNLESPSYETSEPKLHNTEVEIDIESIAHMQQILQKEFHGRVLNEMKGHVAERMSPVEFSNCGKRNEMPNAMVSECGACNGAMSSAAEAIYTTVSYRIQGNESQTMICKGSAEISSKGQNNDMQVLKNEAGHQVAARRPARSHLNGPVLEQQTAGNDTNSKSTAKEMKDSKAFLSSDMKANIVIPVFGVWNNETSSETYTHVFERVREKKRGGLQIKVPERTPVNKEKGHGSHGGLPQEAQTPVIKPRLTIAKFLQHTVAHDKKSSSGWSLCFLAPMTIE